MTCPRCSHKALADKPRSYTVTDDGTGFWRLWICQNSPGCGHAWWVVRPASHAQAKKPTGGEAA